MVQNLRKGKKLNERNCQPRKNMEKLYLKIGFTVCVSLYVSFVSIFLRDTFFVSSTSSFVYFILMLENYDIIENICI